VELELYLEKEAFSMGGRSVILENVRLLMRWIVGFGI
jgi:hypothetical protein